MGVLARVQRTFGAPTAEAQKVLAETPNTEAYERLSVFVNGRFRGLAAAIEELALELDAMREQLPAAFVQHERQLPVPGRADEEAKEPDESVSHREPAEGVGEAALAEPALASLAETHGLREQRDN